MDLLKDLCKGDDPKFLLFANGLTEITKLLTVHGKSLSDIKAIVDRGSDTKLNVTEALAALDSNYYFTTSAEEYYAPYGTHGGIVDSDSRLIMTERVKESKYSRMIPVINPELIIVVPGGFIDFLKIHRIDYDGGHLSYTLRYNVLPTHG